MHTFLRNFFFTILLFAFFSVPIPSISATNSINVTVDEKVTSYQAITTGSLAFLSARDFADLYAMHLAYNSENKIITLTSGKTKIFFTIGSNTMIFNGKKHSLDASPMILNNTTYLPMKALSILENASYAWNTQTLYIRKDGGKITLPNDEKVLLKTTSVNVAGKKTSLHYILIPKASNLNANIILAQNEIGQTESLKSMASRSSAKAAINGSFFQSYDNSKFNDPYGIIIKNGTLVHSENTGSTIGFTNNGIIKIDTIRSVITTTIHGTQYPISLLNHIPSTESNAITLFTNARGSSTGCSFGTSVVIKNGEVVSIVNKQSVAIPNKGYVLLFTGSKTSIAQSIKRGTKISYKVQYTNLSGSAVDWSNIKTAVSAGPILLKDGVISPHPEKEGFSDTAGFRIAITRSAIGITASGDILLIGSFKCTLEQLASVMQQLGAVQAISMDSGSSSGLYLTHNVISAPSKEISNALIFK